MQPNSVGDFPVPVATSGAPTDDGQSTRQLHANMISSEEVPTASFRAHMPYERSTISSKQRRGGNLVLFVKSSENESEAAPRGTSFAPQQQQANSSGADGDVESVTDEGDENVGKDREDAPSLVISTVADAVGSVGSMATGATRRPLVTAALVLLYFILLDLVLLSGNERLNRVLRRMRAAEDDALILLSTSLVRQMAEAKRELRDAVTQRGGKVKTELFEMARHKVEALERVCNRSISRLHAKLMFPGSVEDLLFLIEAHATYDERLRELAANELHWATTVMTGHVVHAGGDGVEESRPHGLGTARPAAHSSAAGGDAHPSEEGDTDAALNPLRNVRLQHVRQYRAPTKFAARSYARRPSTEAKSAATSRRQSGGTSTFASAVSVVKTTARGLLEVVSNKLVAFLLICVLLSAVLRMG
ncbi:conserved hypothetical protein [Leishmania infantum JPCM5]|uniref:Uncharacterized protein n=2 Tax=Leishmania infantum TaxID=5671 RepID=A4I2Q5_LEIIN|nr:conserved hypothetical protein [Leishmania infantum JPCM5]CAC9499415.1 hypothetical_protein_-_conserved [Leishmania infantum]CAM69052.1 conserved hypothetical protein [Leishmania infantum JPCM5]SUZ42988.1 hypothetical_protein_-_conserved [Leishmania infantum]|eukprot:XP_001466338.1 conserved hypothetical protein [Leishmania infantum JPCM5]